MSLPFVTDFSIAPIPATRWHDTFSAAVLKDRRIRELRYWLQLEGSLTRALQLRCEHRFEVDILNEGFARPTVEERLRLNIPLNERAWIREVCLRGDQQPWVLARTVIPLGTLSGRGRLLRHLGKRPLGAFLFSHRDWQRGDFEFGLCHGNSRLGPLAARRSIFNSCSGSLLVGEYFLPSLRN